jgi:hypothetical protein
MLCSEIGAESQRLERFPPPFFLVELFDGITTPIFPAFGNLNKERRNAKPATQ